MAVIVASFTANSVPLELPGTLPTLRIRRTDTQALVVTDAAMVEQGDGNYSFVFSPVDGLEYAIRADGDPLAAGQVPPRERYVFGALSGTEEARIETDIVTILAGEPFVAKQQLAFDTVNNLLTGNVWLERANAPVTTVTAVVTTLYDEDGASLFTFTATGPDAQGVFKVERSSPGLVSGQPYYFDTTFTVTGVGAVVSRKGLFTVG